MLGRKRCAAHASKVLDKIDRRRERPALQGSVPRSGHRKPWTLDRKENRDHIPDRVPRGGIRHHRPIPAPISPVIQDPAQHQQIHEVSEISELHEIVAHRRCKLFQPHCRLHTGQPVIGGDQLGVLPAGCHQMRELSELLKAKQKKQMRIPVPPEMPELRRKRVASPVRALRNLRFYTAQCQNDRGNQSLYPDQLQPVCKIFRKHRDHRTRCRQISQRHPLECAARRPRCRHFAGEASRDSLLLCFEAGRMLLTSRGGHFRTPRERCFIPSTVLSPHFLHSGLSDVTSSVRPFRPAPHKRHSTIQSLQAAFSSPRALSPLCLSPLCFRLPPNPARANHASAPRPQGLSTDSLPQAGQPPPATTDRSSCRRTRSIAPGRDASPQPAASPRALSLPQTSLRPRLAPSTGRLSLRAASQTRESSP